MLESREWLAEAIICHTVNNGVVLSHFYILVCACMCVGVPLWLCLCVCVCVCISVGCAEGGSGSRRNQTALRGCCSRA